MALCVEFNINLPDSFPLAEWRSLYAAGMQTTANQDEAQGEFIRAMGCVTYRYKSCQEAVSSMIDNWHTNGQQLTFETYYTMQRDLFSFFTCGLSSVESLLYGCYVIATHKHPAILPWADLKARRRKTDPDKFSATLLTAYPAGHPLITEIAAVTSSQEWKDWNDYRNTMVHRSLPSRLLEAAVGAPAPPNVMIKYASSWSNKELRADESQMDDKLTWLADQIRKLCIEAAKL